MVDRAPLESTVGPSVSQNQNLSVPVQNHQAAPGRKAPDDTKASSKRKRVTIVKSHSRENLVNDHAYTNRGQTQATLGTALKGTKPRSLADPALASKYEELVEPELGDELHIWKRHRAGRRAQLPDLDSTTAQNAATDVTPHRKSVLSPIELAWSKSGDKLHLTRSSAESRSTQANAVKQVLWKHCKEDNFLSLKNFKALTQNDTTVFSERDEKVTDRILAQMKETCERSLVDDGKFLEPYVGRYDSRDPSGKTIDKCAIFLNFPYLLVQDVRTVISSADSRGNDPMNDAANGSDKDHHPLRSLLRYHFRLSKTVDQDRRQSISSLKSKEFAGCIDPLHIGRKISTRNLSVFAPQLWCLVLGEGTLLTDGYIQHEDLKGADITITDPQPSTPLSTNETALIRISFRDDNYKVNNLVFPLDQCDCFFGLLNKHRQILEPGLGPKFLRQESMKYPLYFRDANNEDKRITKDNWCNILLDREESEELRVQINYDDSEESQKEVYSSVTPAVFRRILHPLLEWPVFDEYEHEEEGIDGETRAKGFMKNICTNLPILLHGTISAPSPRGSITSIQRFEQSSFSPKRSYTGKSLGQVMENFEENRRQGNQTDHDLRCQKVVELTHQLLKLFLNEQLAEDSEATSYVWGSLFVLNADPKAQQLSDKDFDFLSREITVFFHLAEFLHIGVYRQHAKFTNRKIEDIEDKFSSGAILLNATIRAFENILRLFFELAIIVLELPDQVPDDSSKSQLDELPEQSFIEVDEAFCRHADKVKEELIMAREELIVEADRNVQMTGLGPSATPVGVLISLLNRLSQGVFGGAKVNIIQVYNKNLQVLATRVRDKPNRRLLRELNDIQEEMNIVREIYMQQAKVLSDFHDIVNWDNYDGAHTAARRLNFKYESAAIQKILKAVRARVKDINELHQRATKLSDQNVQSLETVQDDNNKVLYVFTLVTVLFLPASFVAGYFGMNVSDIRDTTRTTYHFWIIAGPLTIGVIIASVAVALLHDTFLSLFWRITRGPVG